LTHCDTEVICSVCGKKLKFQGLGIHLKKHKNDFTSEQKNFIVEKYKNGLSAIALSEQLSCSVDKIYSVLKEKGIPRRKFYETTDTGKERRSLKAKQMWRNPEMKQKIITELVRAIKTNPEKHYKFDSVLASKAAKVMWEKYKNDKEFLKIFGEKHKGWKHTEESKRLIGESESATKLGIEPQLLALKIKELIDNGLSRKQIAKNVGRDISVVRRLTTKYLGEEYINKLRENGIRRHRENAVKCGRNSKGNPDSLKKWISKNRSWILGLSKENDIRVMKLSQRVSKTVSLLWKDEDYVRKIMKSRLVKPNKLEIEFDKWLQNNFPNEWVYTGDGKVIINGRCPDWMSRDEKSVILLNGIYWHLWRLQKHNPLLTKEQVEEQQRQIYKGYNCIIIWEDELENLNKDMFEAKRNNTFTQNIGCIQNQMDYGIKVAKGEPGVLD